MDMIRSGDRLGPKLGAKTAAYIEALERELAEAEQQCDALSAKVQALAPHNTCACSYDKPGDVCMHHSPALVAAEAQVTRLTEALSSLVAKLDAIDKPVTDVFVFAGVHGYHYDGPNYADELKAAKFALVDNPSPAKTSTGGQSK
jgi:uncharacterized coiled-coil protein SlyX